jgi:small-conductance mechanosensitive channel
VRTIREWIEQTLGVGGLLYYKLGITLLIVTSLFLLRRAVLYIVLRKVEDVRQRYLWRKTSAYIFFFLGLLIVGATWVEGVKAFSTFLGLLSAGIAIALREPLVNLAGWGFIMWRRPFGVGDRVQIGIHAGDVIDTRIFQFSLLEIGNWVDADQSTGRIINVPNGKIFSETLANYTTGFQFIWDEIPVLITFESNWEKAKDILREVVDRHTASFTETAEKQIRKAASRFLIYFKKLTPIVYTTVKESGVLLTIRYLVEPKKRRGYNEAIWEDILRQFAQHDDIDFAYPTQRFYTDTMERKEKSSV